MNLTIWKYHLLALTGEITISMPAPGEILSVGNQGGSLVLWARVDPAAPNLDRKVCIRGTGHPHKGNEGQFIGTVQMNSRLVWHLFYQLD